MKFAPVQQKFFAFKGGLDEETPSIMIPAGVAISATNFECGTYGGYTRIGGYERFDGRAKPSDATYSSIPVSITGAYAIGNTITGATSGATAIIIAANATTFFITKITGTFVAETLNISGLPVATSSAGSSSGGAGTPALNAQYKNLAADQYRADIAAVPGSGSILGVWQFNGNKYAFRNNTGGTAAVMHKSSASGWASVALGKELSFTSGGTTEIQVGNTITGATSGATAVIAGVGLQSGSWGAGTAAGIVTFASQTGTFQAEDLNIGASLNVATISGDSTAITLLPGGRYEFLNHNFGGAYNTTKMYGCDGVNKAFEFDGTAFIRISTGMATDTPEHITEFKKHLFISIAGSVQHSGIGTPHAWSIITGAGEIAVGDQCTGFMTQPGSTTAGAMVIFNRNQTYVLYGTTVADWNLTLFNPESGAIEWTTQYIGQGVMLDDRGITTLATSQNFGNFSGATISNAVKRTLSDLMGTSVASCIVREKNQYRIFFSGGRALYVTFSGNKVAGIMPITTTETVSCICSQESASGAEEIYFGSTNGMVYQMDVGTSFDGEKISANLELAYNHLQSPQTLKQFRRMTLEARSDSYGEVDMTYRLGYSSPDIPQPTSTTLQINTSSAYFDSGESFDSSVFFDGRTLIPLDADIDGVAENISLAFSSYSDEHDSFTLSGATITFTPRRMKR